MARIPRKFLKVFARDASNNGVFGSAADNTKILSNDVEVIQSKPAWYTGWIDAVIGTRKFPTLEEFQSCNYVNTSQIAYLFQEGIPEWNALTEYHENSIVKKTGTYEIYGSLTGPNTGNLLSDDTNWEFLQDLGESYQQATTSLLGIAMLATVADVISKNDQKIVTPNLLNEHGFITGDWKGTTRPTLQAGWCWGAGTIGNASSGATYAAADSQNLFNLYWNATEYNYTGTTATGAALQVFDSAGVAVSKGASASADWAANRRISVVDFRDRVPAGRGNMVGNAGRLSGQVGGVNGNGLGDSGGDESQTLTAAQMLHNHETAISGQLISAGAARTIVTSSWPAGLTDRMRTFRRTAGPTDTEDSFSTWSGPSENAASSPHNNVQPTIISNIVIKL